MGKARGSKEKPRRPPGQSRVSSPISAPGGLALVQGFLSTVSFKSGADGLATPRDLSDWLSRNALLPAGTELGEVDLGRAREVRAGLRALLRANSGGTLDEAAVVRLDRAAAGARAQVRFERDGTTSFELVSRDVGDALGTLLGIVHVARCMDKWRWLKVCANPECRRVFFDFTKNSTGRWCTQRCGVRLRARALRRRQLSKSQ